MKHDLFMPFYGGEFFEAMAGHSESVGMAYLRALWHYWGHTGCTGLPNDDEYLRRVCGCERAEWARTKGIIFDNRYHFRLEEGLWQQARGLPEWSKKRGKDSYGQLDKD